MNCIIATFVRTGASDAARPGFNVLERGMRPYTVTITTLGTWVSIQPSFSEMVSNLEQTRRSIVCCV